VPLAFYIDEHVDSAITNGLRLRGIDVLTVQEDGFNNTDDVLILDRAFTLSRAMCTQDRDFLVEVARRQATGEEFATVFYSAQSKAMIGRLVDDLEYSSLVAVPSDLTNALHYLPF
jgi:hypothetical protein